MSGRVDPEEITGAVTVDVTSANQLPTGPVTGALNGSESARTVVGPEIQIVGGAGPDQLTEVVATQVTYGGNVIARTDRHGFAARWKEARPLQHVSELPPCIILQHQVGQTIAIKIQPGATRRVEFRSYRHGLIQCQRLVCLHGIAAGVVVA